MIGLRTVNVLKIAWGSILFLGLSGCGNSFTPSSELRVSSLQENEIEDQVGGLDGKAIYTAQCAACHSPISNTSVQIGTADNIKLAIAGVPLMSHLALLSDEEIAAVALAISDAKAIADAPVVCSPTTKVDSAPTARRLTRFQYFTTLNSIFGVNTDDLVYLFPSEIRYDGFTNQEVSLGVSRAHITAFRDLAVMIVEERMPDFTSWRSANVTACNTKSSACFNEYVSNLGYHLFRRPVNSEELSIFNLVYSQYNEELASIDETLKAVTIAMLQSPQFLYRLESIEENVEERPVDPYTLASRLSFLVWQTGPDRTLLDLAASGEIMQESIIRSEVRRMLNHPNARASLQHYVQDWLGLEQLGGIDIDPAKYPEMSSQLIEDMKTQTALYFDDLVFAEQSSLLDSLTDKSTFLNSRIGKLYGLDITGEEFVKRDVASLPGRMGFLSHPSVLMAPLKSDHPSIVQRGIYMTEDVFCQEIPSAPPGVANDLVLPLAGTSQRDKLDAHRSEVSCASCHASLDGPGLAFDNFNTIGAFRLTDEYNNALESSGNWLLKSQEVQWSNTEEFLNIAKNSPTVKACFVKKALQFSLGRSLRAADQCVVDDISPEFAAGNFTFQTLIEEIGVSKSFQVITNEGE